MLSNKKRKLNESDLVRMRLPRLHWKCVFDRISNVGGEGSPHSMIKRYFSNLKEMHREGKGLIFWGMNGTGKTGILGVIGKAMTRWGLTVLFMEFASIRRIVIDKMVFDEDQTLWERALAVDVLLIDDIGKGLDEQSDKSGFGARIFDELIRHRIAHRRITFLTTNMTIKELQDRLMLSTNEVIKEGFVAGVKVEGKNFRDEIKTESQDKFNED